MAGYMGFGMQSWLYKKRPRKPFTKRGQVPSFTPLHSYTRTFSIKPHVKKNNVYAGLITLVAISISILLVVNYSQKFVSYSQERLELIEYNTSTQESYAFSYLLNSGKQRLLSNNILGAYSEFNLAYNIRPDSKELNQLLVETLSILCSDDIKYCDVLDNFLDNQP